MKLANTFNLLALSAAIVVAGAGCRHTPTDVTKIPGITRGHISNPGIGPESINPSPPVYPNPGFGPGVPSTTATGIAFTGPGHQNWHEDPSALSAQTIHFDYDKSAIKSSEDDKLNAVATYLKEHQGQAVRIEGNCDERGTEEYNRSLGERRALAAREYLAGLGIDPTRIDTVTYGKDKPVDTGHDESAWARNRRDDFVVLSQP